MSPESRVGPSRPAFRTLRLVLLSIAALLFSISAVIQWTAGDHGKAVFVTALAVGAAANAIILLRSART